jgi:Ulp1 family protease
LIGKQPLKKRSASVVSNEDKAIDHQALREITNEMAKNTTKKLKTKSGRSPPPPPHRPHRSLSPEPQRTPASSSNPTTVEPNEEVLVYPFDGEKAVIITNNDMSRLDDKRFLNDVLMDAYPKILQDEHPQKQIHIFSSLFFTRLTKSGKNAHERSKTIKYEQVKKWTKNVNLFEKEYIIIPIEQKNHWLLAIVTNPGYCVGRIPDDDVMIAEDLDEAPKSEKT